ncbi:hypothetical protein [Brevibacillus brevis]|uniref:hypothetical protein n=1 Tax=Brevibacillus brevis TaxID=1393 RepID=UPI0025A52930|nr:hypothetical protein [Brevibacillus brevis]WJQ80616.1 hypothetical protein QN310_24645 [Brevibacillus brevis]
MQKKKHILVASSLTTALLFNVLTPTMAMHDASNSAKRNDMIESLYKLDKSMEAAEGLSEAELAKKVFNSLTPEAQENFVNFMVKQSEAGDSSLLDYHEEVIGKVEKVNNKMEKMPNKTALKADPLDILSTKLDRLKLPRPVYYSFMAVGGGIAAAAADGPLPIGDIIGVLIAVGAGAVVGYYWDEIEPKFDEIIEAFQDSFTAMADEIVEAFNYLYAKGIIYYYDIPKRLLNDKGDGVDLGQFDKRIDGKTRENEKTGWSIQKDRGNKPHGGSAWKLRDSKGNRKATLDDTGKILRE